MKYNFSYLKFCAVIFRADSLDSYINRFADEREYNTFLLLINKFKPNGKN